MSPDLCSGQIAYTRQHVDVPVEMQWCGPFPDRWDEDEAVFTLRLWMNRSYEDARIGAGSDWSVADDENRRKRMHTAGTCLPLQGSGWCTVDGRRLMWGPNGLR